MPNGELGEGVRPTREVFILSEGPDDYLVYAPLRGRVFAANAAFVNHLAGLLGDHSTDETIDQETQRLRELKQLDLLEDEAERAFLATDITREFCPTEVTILPTTACNFRCRYCYASSGDQRHGIRHIDPLIAHAAVRFVIDNACQKGVETCYLSFRGGGEPLTKWRLLADVVEKARAYAKERRPSLTLSVSLITNGYLRPEVVDWVASSVDSMMVSLDGPPDVQNDQRPLASGSPTFDRVLAVLEEFHRRGVPEVKARATVSSRYVERIPEIMRFVCQHVPVQQFYLAPVVREGRCLETGYSQPDLHLFAEGMRVARQVAASFGKQAVSSLPDQVFSEVRRQYCGANLPSFTVTPDGLVTACQVVMDSSDPRSRVFHYGAWDGVAKEFRFDAETIERLRGRHVNSLAQCRDCFAKYQCVGGCPKERVSGARGEETNADDMRCEVNREVVRSRLREALGTAKSPVTFGSNTVSVIDAFPE